MKKTLSLILALLMLFVCIPTATASYTDTVDSDVLLVSSLGLMEGYDDGTFLPDNNVTRAEFAQIIANIYKVETDSQKEWNDLYFKDQETEMGVITDYGEEAEPRFSDVDSSHWAYDAVNTVYSLGYMDGVSATQFAPDDKLTAPQIYKILSVMLGYRVKADIKGGYPNGYISVARELGISSGITNYGEITRAEVAKILVNAFDVEMLYTTTVGEKTTYESYEDKTFLTEIMNVNKVVGRMTDNGITNFTSESSIYEKNVIVNGVTVRLTDDTDYIRDFMGRNIDLYYKVDKNNDVKSAVYAVLNNKDEVVTFDAKHYKGTDLNTLSYETNDKIKNLKLKNGATLIKNGMVVSIPKEADFKVNKGTFTVVKPYGSSSYDMVILDSYTSFYVDAVDSVNKKVYSLASLVDERSIDFSNEDKTYIIYDESGARMNFETLTSGMVLSVSDSARLLKVYISTKILANVAIEGKATVDGDVFVTIGGKEYKVSKDFIQLKGDMLDVTKKYNLYLDKFGDIVNGESAAESNISVALMIDVKNFGNLEADYQMKYFDQDGSMKISSIADKVTFVNGSGVESVVKNMDSLLTQLTGYDELFRYKLDSDKKINYIELASNQKATDNPKNRLLRIKLSSVDASEYTADPYYKPGNAINGKAVVDNTTTVAFVHPTDFSVEESFRITTMPNVLKDDGNSGKNIMAYTIEGDSPFANYIISRDDAAAALSAGNKLAAIVKSVTKGLDTKGDPMNVITVYENGTAVETKLYCTDDVLDNVVDMWGRKHCDYDSVNNEWRADAQKYKIEMGDVIRYLQNSDKSLKKIYLMFDENAKNPHSGGQGNLAGSYGYYNANQTEAEGMIVGANVNSNPYSLQSGSTYDDYDETATAPLKSGHFWGKPLQWSATELRVFLAYPFSSTNNSFTVTTQDLSVNDYDYNFNQDNYMQESYKRTSNLTLYVIDGNNLYPTSVSASGLKTYKLAGNDCDRIFMYTRAGNPSAIIPIRGKTSN